MSESIYWCKGGVNDPFNRCHRKRGNVCKGEHEEVKDCRYRYVPHPSVLSKGLRMKKQ